MMAPNSGSSNLIVRSIQTILPSASSPHWVGDGFHVNPVFSSAAFTKTVSPFLMFDYGAPRHVPPSKGGKPRGVGQHPHRGFETVTVAFQGEVEHHDSKGNSGIVRAGDVQWMTAGRGIVHQEYLSHDFTSSGGTLEMCQLWVNLPRQYKMTKPRYQSITGAQIPVVNLPLANSSSNNTDTNTAGDEVLGTARIIAGELGGVKGPAKTFSPIQLWDVSFPKNTSNGGAVVVVDIPFPADQACIVFVRRGSIEILGSQNGHDGGSGGAVSNKEAKVLKLQQVAILNNVAARTTTNKDAAEDTCAEQQQTSIVRVRVLERDTCLLIMGGEVIDEPIAAQGPFAMNTQQEINKAMVDYRSGKF
jgi:quercetin 2,3-dioxygenase